MVKDTPEAMRMLESLGTAHPEISQAHFSLAQATSWGRFKDLGRSQKELESFLRVCPAPLEGSALSMVVQHGSADQIRRVATMLRQRLEKESDPILPGVWEALWRLEFKTRPTTE